VRRRKDDRKICEKEKRRQKNNLEGERLTGRDMRRRDGDRKLL